MDITQWNVASSTAACTTTAAARAAGLGPGGRNACQTGWEAARGAATAAFARHLVLDAFHKHREGWVQRAWVDAPGDAVEAVAEVVCSVEVTDRLCWVSLHGRECHVCEVAAAEAVEGEAHVRDMEGNLRTPGTNLTHR